MLKTNYENTREELEMLFKNYCSEKGIELEYCEVYYDSDIYDEDDEDNLGESVLNIFYKLKDDNCEYSQFRKEKGLDDEHSMTLYNDLSLHDFTTNTLFTYFRMTGYSPCNVFDSFDFIDYASYSLQNKYGK